MHSSRLPKLTSTATAASTGTATSVVTSVVSQSEFAAGQRQQEGSFAGFSTTVYTPESRHIPAAERYVRLRLSAEISASQLQIDPFVTLATHQAVTFDDEAQEQSAISLSLPDEPLLSNEPPQATDDVDPIMVVAKPHETRISEDPKRPGGQNLADQNTDSTDKWIMYSGDETRPFKCGYKGCRKTYTTKQILQRHFVSHIGGLQFRCYTGGCTGTTRYCDKQALDRHIRKKHTSERPYECDFCNKRFMHSDTLASHRRKLHSVRNEQTDKWIILTGDADMPFQCGYEGCGRKFTRIQSLKSHFPRHARDSQLRCYLGDCSGKIRFRDRQKLLRHVRVHHTFEKPYQCELCDKRFRCIEHLKYHREHVHSIKDFITTECQPSLETALA